MFPIMDVKQPCYWFGGRVMGRCKAKISELTGDDHFNKAGTCMD